MPELPEVERGRRLAEAVAEGRVIARVQAADDPIVLDGVRPEALRRALAGRTVLGVRRWGKQLWFELDRGPHPLFHFGMTGSFHVPDAAALRLESGPAVDGRWPPRFMKLRLRFTDGGELAISDARRLGRIRLRADPTAEPPISRLGFDPLLALPSPAKFIALLRGRRAVIKALLLDQSFAAGVGNWIADEVLYQARIDPRRRADCLDPSEARRLRAKLRSVVARAVAVDADRDRYPRGWLFHRRWGRRPGQTTLRGHRIEHLTISGRSTAWVPAVQS